MKLTERDLYAGILRAFEGIWSQNIRDRQATPNGATVRRLKLTSDQVQHKHDGDNHAIAALIHKGGAQWLLAKDGPDDDEIGDYYEGNKVYWCGAGASGVLSSVGDYLLPGQCVDLRLRRDVGKYVMPSCSRLNGHGWSRADGLKELQVMGKPQLEFNRRGVAIGMKDSAIPGMVATCWTHSLSEPLEGRPDAGDHIVILAGMPVEVDGRLLVPTYECNGYGWLGSGKWGEGVVKRTPENRPDLMRPLSAFRRVYPIGLQHFEGEALALFGQGDE